MALDRMAIGVMLAVGEDPGESIQKVLDVGVNNAQMGRPGDEWLTEEKALELKKKSEEMGITVTTVFCGFDGESYADIPTVRQTVGFVPTETRAERLAKAKEIADFAKVLGVETVAAHIGFVPEEPGDPQYQDVVNVVGEFADYLKSNGQRLSLETGQETAPTLLRFIKDLGRENVRVNFDPANMILYGSGDPIEASSSSATTSSASTARTGRRPRSPTSWAPRPRSARATWASSASSARSRRSATRAR